MTHYDVIISGCGPVGATLALLLEKQGMHSLVLEKYAEVYDKPRAIVLDWEIMRIFQFCGIAHVLKPTIVPHTGTDFIGMEGQLIKLFDPLPPPYALGWPATLMFIQPELERILREQIEKSASIDLKLSCNFDDLEEIEGGVKVVYTDLASGKNGQASADFLVGCDGANSQVRTSLNIGFHDYQFDEWWLVVDAWQISETELPRKTTQYCWPSRPATYVVGPQNLRRWEIKLLPGEQPKDFDAEEKLLDVLGTYVDINALNIWRSATYRFNARVGEKWRKGRVFLGGDAMHQTPPFLGQGLCAGLRDVSNLSWKLAHAKHHGINDQLLDSYEKERFPHVSTVIEHGKEFGLIIGELDREKAQKRDEVLRAQLLSGEVETTRQGFIPNLTTGLIDATQKDEKLAALAGTLMVQPKIQQAEQNMLLDDLMPMKFLFVTYGEAPQQWAQQYESLFHEFDIQRIAIGTPGNIPASPLYSSLPEAGTTFTEWAQEHNVKAVLVRPDRYVYGALNTDKALGPMVESLAGALRNTAELAAD